AAPRDKSNSRYLKDLIKVPDQNTGQNERDIFLQTLRLKLFFDTEKEQFDGWVSIPLVRFKLNTNRRTEEKWKPDPSFIPPLLRCDARPAIRKMINRLDTAITAKVNLLSDRIRERGTSAYAGGSEDARLVDNLRWLRVLQPSLSVLRHAPGMHPLDLYLELSRALGFLAAIDPAEEPPALPDYDHNDLGSCFKAVHRSFDRLLDRVVRMEYSEK